MPPPPHSPAPQQDHKERNFCFAYRGEQLQPSLFDDLHFQSAKGTYCIEDGLWYVSVTLARGHGRRASGIPNVLEEYNRHCCSGDGTENRKIHPVHLPQMPSSVVCFKATDPGTNNVILNRIHADRRNNPAYWTWDRKKSRAAPPSPAPTDPRGDEAHHHHQDDDEAAKHAHQPDQTRPAKKRKPRTRMPAATSSEDAPPPDIPDNGTPPPERRRQAPHPKERHGRQGKAACDDYRGPIKMGLEGLARELNLNPAELDMKSAYISISRSYFAAHQKYLGASGQFNAADRSFLVDELARFFSDKLQYVSRPFRAAAAGADGGGSGASATAARKLLLLRRGGGSESILAALAAANGGSVDDFEFLREDSSSSAELAADGEAGAKDTGVNQDPPPEKKRKSPQEEGPNPFVPETPNDTICAFFRGILPRWLQQQHQGGAHEVQTVEIAARDIVTALNGGKDGGAYRTTCVAGFLRPFVLDGLIRPMDEQLGRPSRYRVNIRGVAAKLGIH